MQGLGMDKLDGYAMRPIRKSLVQMKAKQYQIVSVDRLMITQQEYEVLVQFACTLSLFHGAAYTHKFAQHRHILHIRN